MRELEFIGEVRSNKGKFHKDMVVPGRESLSSAPDDWPTQLAPGTLNIGIEPEGFPADFDDIGTSKGVRRLDEGKFKPAFVIAQHEITGNTLKPKAGHPRRGTAQLLRAELRKLSTDETVKCCMLRRIGSKISSQIELVAEVPLRNALSLRDGAPVSVVIYSG